VAEILIAALAEDGQPFELVDLVALGQLDLDVFPHVRPQRSRPVDRRNEYVSQEATLVPLDICLDSIFHKNPTTILQKKKNEPYS
jgi:hypothetical protein